MLPKEPQPQDKINIAFIVDTKGKPLNEVANFPVISTEEAMLESEQNGSRGYPAKGRCSG